MKLKVKKSLNYSKKSRDLKNIKYIIIHYTGMQSARESLKRLLDKKTKVSCHYFIDRKGEILNLVDDNKIAWHAGKSKWKRKKNLNDESIGIELQNKGHFKNYEKFTNLQIKSLIKVIKRLMKKYNIKKYNVLGHSDIAPLRKLDPGENFPWKLLSSKGLSIWFSKKQERNYEFKDSQKRVIFFKNIFKIGYRYFNLSNRNKGDVRIIKAFQMRFLPKEVSGKITDKTLHISQLLAK